MKKTLTLALALATVMVVGVFSFASARGIPSGRPVLTANISESGSKWWLWTDDAPHHTAIVQVRAGNNGGTGTLVYMSEDGKTGVVATAQHVVEGYNQVRCIWPTMKKDVTGQVIMRSSDEDIAYIYLDPPDASAVVPISKTPPKPGDWVEVCGYGGPTSETGLRHFKAKAKEGTTENRVFLDGSVISGDSGGAMICNGKLVAVVYGGRYRVDHGLVDSRGNRWTLVHPASGAGTGPLRRLWSAWAERRRIRRYGGDGGGGGYGQAPPAPDAPLPDDISQAPDVNPPAPVETPDIQQQPTPAQVPQPQPQQVPQQGAIAINTEALIEAIAIRMLQDPRFMKQPCPVVPQQQPVMPVPPRIEQPQQPISPTPSSAGLQDLLLDILEDRQPARTPSRDAALLAVFQALLQDTGQPQTFEQFLMERIDGKVRGTLEWELDLSGGKAQAQPSRKRRQRKEVENAS